MATESGRPCGCDPAAEYVCAGHAAHRDDSEVAYQGHRQTVGGLSTAVVAITGPLGDGEFAIDTDHDTVYLDRWALEALVDEAQRRLAGRV